MKASIASKPVTRVAWISRHTPLPSQLAALEAHFGPCEIRRDVRPFADAEEIVRRVRTIGADECVVVAPLSVLARLVALGMRPLWAEMKQLPSAKGSEVTVSGRYYRFVRFRRVKALRMEFEDV